MALDATIHSGDIGTTFQITIVDANNSGIDISSASGDLDKLILFGKPGKPSPTVQYNASFVGDGTSGIMDYTAVSGDLDTVGTWELQGFVNLTDGAWYSNKQTFSVIDNVAKVTGVAGV